MTQSELSPANLEARNVAADNATVATRIEAFRSRTPQTDAALLITPERTPDNSPPMIPEIDASRLSADELRAALTRHGSLIVRKLFSQESMDALIPVVDRVLDACQRHSTGDTPAAGPYFNPPNNLVSIMPNRDRELGNTRNFHRESGSAMCIEAPSVAETLLDFYEAHGIKALVTDYLGEAPCLTAKKWVLRRSLLPVAEAGWHQDGAFMGTHINSVNMWIPLNECGGYTGAPGMDVVPRRLTGIMPAAGAQFDWSVSTAEAQATSGGEGIIAPVFNAGDAFFFDHYFLHRTQYGIDFSKIRYAIETWFFGENSFPKNQIPLAW